MAQKINLPLPAWEGMHKIDEISMVVGSLRPEMDFLNRYINAFPKKLKLQEMRVRSGEDAHLKATYYYPTQGTVVIELSGLFDEDRGMMFWGCISLKASWKCLGGKSSIELNARTIRLIETLSTWRKNVEYSAHEYKQGQSEFSKSELKKLEEKTKKAIDMVSIAYVR